MLNILETTPVYFAIAPIDMRKQIDGIALCVQEVYALDPFDSAFFAFCNRNRDKTKILWWHANGFCLLYKRMEKNCFCWPTSEKELVQYSLRELQWLLSGLPLDDLRPIETLQFDRV